MLRLRKPVTKKLNCPGLPLFMSTFVCDKRHKTYCLEECVVYLELGKKIGNYLGGKPKKNNEK